MTEQATYHCWSEGLPQQYIDAPTSFAARIEYAKLRGLTVTDCAARKMPYGLHLPLFVAFYDAPTEDRLERVIERLCNHADAALMSGKATQTQYDAWQVALHHWSKTVKLEG